MEANNRSVHARRARALICAAMTALLGACQTAPPVPTAPSTAAKRIEALRALGFVESADGWMLNLATPILFEVNRDELKPEMRKAVSDLAEALRRAGIDRVRVEGHTDNHGSRDYNVDLSRRRADAVARELIGRGFAEDAIARRAWGYEYPAAPNDTPDGRALNRRVTIVVLPPETAAE